MAVEFVNNPSRHVTPFALLAALKGKLGINLRNRIDRSLIQQKAKDISHYLTSGSGPCGAEMLEFEAP